MSKSRDAFRTISEVSEWLEAPAHVIRFWESKFSQIKPVKRAGGRRYFRPEDIALLGGIKALLHDDGYTIKGVQKLLREKGVGYVSGFGPGFGTEDTVENVSSSSQPHPDNSLVKKEKLAQEAPRPQSKSEPKQEAAKTEHVDSKKTKPASAEASRPHTIPAWEVLAALTERDNRARYMGNSALKPLYLRLQEVEKSLSR